MFFADLLNNIVPRAVVYHEAGERSRLINILSHAHLGGFVPFEAPLWAWKRAITPDLLNCTQEIYIDSNNHLYALLPLKLDLYPKLRIIHIVRDPRDYVRSHINWARHRFKSFIANYLIPFWQPNAFLMHKMTIKEWWQLSRFERYCWVWDFKNRFIGEIEKTNYPYLRICFEDFFNNADPLEALNRLLIFLDLEKINDIDIRNRFTRTINPGIKKSFPHWTDWSQTHCQQLDHYCGEIMALYEYGQEKEWRSKLGSRSATLII